jgi:hypothetical protein
VFAGGCDGLDLACPWFSLAALLSWLYTLSDLPEAHVQAHRGLVRVVSILLFAHVFCGTHMVLGLLKRDCPLDWYAAQPLESRSGWITLGAVGYGLAWRSFGLHRVLYFVNQRAGTAEEYLRFLDYLCKNVSIWYFITVLGVAWSRGDSLVSLILILLVGGVYHLSRLSVWQ